MIFSTKSRRSMSFSISPRRMYQPVGLLVFINSLFHVYRGKCFRAISQVSDQGDRFKKTSGRGFRIELAEIENRLLTHPLVNEATVAAKSFGQTEKALIAYVVGENDLTITDLRDHLKSRLQPERKQHALAKSSSVAFLMNR